uniref:Uncharacterized protein n=1 Tax=Timema poppense TaxID=170557 RepID=A0A7R9DS38_TIMPO|nr:unnamed protein product [Timema poppensis]
MAEGRIHRKCIRICVEGESETFKEKITGIQIRTFSIIGKPKKMHLTPLPEFPQVLYSIYDRSISKGANCGLTRIRGPSPPGSKCSPGLTCQLVDGVYVCV